MRGAVSHRAVYPASHVISAIVLEPASFPRGSAGQDLVIRSLSWLVSAAVAGLIGDLTLAASAGLQLDGVSDAVGCRLVVADDEGRRLRAAADQVRGGTVLVLKAGFAPGSELIEELARREGAAYPALLLAAPTTFWQRLLPDRAPSVGILAPAPSCRQAADFAALVRSCRGGTRLAARARPLP